MADGSQSVTVQSHAAVSAWNTIGLLSLISLIWGSIFPLTKIAVQDGLTPITIVTIRLLLASCVLLGVSFLKHSSLSHLTVANLKRLMPIALLLLGVPHIMITWSQYFITSSQAVIIMATVPLLTAFFASILNASVGISRPRRQDRFINTALKLLPGFLGIIVLVGKSAVYGEGDELIGIVAAGIASASCALGILMMSRLPPMPVMDVSTSLCIIAALAMLPAFILTGQSASIPLSFETIAVLAFLGLICTGLSSGLHVKLTSSSGAVYASLGFYLSPIAGLALSALLLGEKLDILYIAAVTLVFSSVYLVSPSANFDLFRRLNIKWKLSP